MKPARVTAMKALNWLELHVHVACVQAWYDEGDMQL